MNINHQILHQSEEKNLIKSSHSQMNLNFSKYKSNLNRRKEYIAIIILAPIDHFFFTNSIWGGGGVIIFRGSKCLILLYTKIILKFSQNAASCMMMHIKYVHTTW